MSKPYRRGQREVRDPSDHPPRPSRLRPGLNQDKVACLAMSLTKVAIQVHNVWFHRVDAVAALALLALAVIEHPAAVFPNWPFWVTVWDTLSFDLLPWENEGDADPQPPGAPLPLHHLPGARREGPVAGLFQLHTPSPDPPQSLHHPFHGSNRRKRG